MLNPPHELSWYLGLQFSLIAKLCKQKGEKIPNGLLTLEIICVF
jgi:hypothetical protein